jgi:hypothetical protein
MLDIGAEIDHLQDDLKAARADLKAAEQERDLWLQRCADAIRERNAAYTDIGLLAAEIDAAAERFRHRAAQT